MARLPFDRADLLLVDRIGKDISGTGLDTNVVGRKFDDHKAIDGELPKVKLIALRGLTPESHGNAVGMGLAEFCRSCLLREADLAATRLNAITAGHATAAMPPLDYETDREILETALPSVGLAEPHEARILWIADTLHLAEVECSEAYLEEAQGAARPGNPHRAPHCRWIPRATCHPCCRSSPDDGFHLAGRAVNQGQSRGQPSEGGLASPRGFRRSGLSRCPVPPRRLLRLAAGDGRSAKGTAVSSTTCEGPTARRGCPPPASSRFAASRGGGACR